VESGGPHTDVGGKGPRPESNVIRLRRDWLGPREELVPIGKIPEPVEEPPLAAADFWGDGSAAMHAPIVGEAPAGVGSGSARAAGRGLASGRTAWAWVVRIGGARRTWVVSGAIAAVVCLGVALATLGSGSAPAPARRTAQAAGAGRPVVEAHRSVRTRVSSAVRRNSPTPAQGVVRHRHRPRHGPRSGGKTRAAVQVAAVYRPASSSDSAATSGAAAVSQPTQAYASQATAAQSRASASPPAFGSRGALGPGSSPGTG
jgi:hypothetical protein